HPRSTLSPYTTLFRSAGSAGRHRADPSGGHNRKEHHMPVVTRRELLEAGVHFGHQTRRWNPKMQRYLFGERSGIYIIDLEQSLSDRKSTRLNSSHVSI